MITYKFINHIKSANVISRYLCQGCTYAVEYVTVVLGTRVSLKIKEKYTAFHIQAVAIGYRGAEEGYMDRIQSGLLWSTSFPNSDTHASLPTISGKNTSISIF